MENHVRRMAKPNGARPATKADLKKLHALINKTTDRLQTTIDQCCLDLDTQFRRIAQLQVQRPEQHVSLVPFMLVSMYRGHV
jgi:hypothetical protein